MRSFKFWMKVCRPHHCLAAGLAAWITALLSNGMEWLTPSNIAAASCMFFSCLGASLFHYGAANRMYARKYWDLVEVDRPKLLTFIGSLAFLISMIIAAIELNWPCFLITLFNTVTIVLYARWLAKHWISKNLVIAIVCATPLLQGWLSGHRLEPIVPYAIAAAFCVYWAREIIKDVSDIKANQGIRVTLPIWLGIVWARRISGIFAGISVYCLLKLGSQILGQPAYVLVPYSIALAMFSITTWSLFRRQHEFAEARWIVYGTWLLLFSFIGVRFAYAYGP